MRSLRPALLALGLCLSPAMISPVLAEAPAASPVPAAAEPVQFYVFSFTDTPVAEAAQDIVGGALAYDLTADPAVDGIVTMALNPTAMVEILKKAEAAKIPVILTSRADSRASRIASCAIAVMLANHYRSTPP